MSIFKRLLRDAVSGHGKGLSRPLNIAHRGASGEAPENTLTAFALALRQGADGIEFDVHLSGDGVPVVIHDARLRRTTSGVGLVSDYPAASLRRLDAGSWFNRRHPTMARPIYMGLRIPLLAEVLAFVKRSGCLAFIEVKQPKVPYPHIEERVLVEIHRAGAGSLATVISFDLPTLQRLRQLDSRIALGLDCTRTLLAIRQAQSAGATMVLPHWAFCSRRFIHRAHRGGLQVVVWGLDHRTGMERKLADGVDGIITRYPARMAELWL